MDDDDRQQVDDRPGPPAFSFTSDHDEEDGEAVLTPALLRAVAVGSLGSLLFGFDSGVVSGALVVIGDDLGGEHLTDLEASWMVSSALLGALVGALVSAKAADRFGRKPVILAGACLFALGAVEQAASQVYKELVLGRVLVGLAVGLTSAVLPIFLSELSPARYRGRAVAALVCLITGGQVSSYVVDAIFFSVPHGWRYMLGIGALPALVQLLLAFTIPETPRYLILRDRIAPARRILRALHPTASETTIQYKIETIQRDLEEEKTISAHLLDSNLIAKFWKEDANKRPLILACGLQFFQQATGFNNAMYFSTLILTQAHFPHPANFAILIAISNFICTIIALRLIDKQGRRPLLLWTIPFMAIGMFLTGLGFIFVKPNATSAGAGAWIALVSMVIFCCAYALGLGNVPWVVQSEVFNQELRALGTSIATAVNWTANLIVAITFLQLSRALTPTGAFWLYGLISIFAWIFAYFYLPETKGLSLEATRALFDSGSKTSARGAYETVRSSAEGEDPRSEEDDNV